MTNLNKTPNAEPDYNMEHDPGVIRMKDYYKMSHSEHVLREQDLDMKFDEVKTQDKNVIAAEDAKQSGDNNFVGNVSQFSSASVLQILLNIIQSSGCELYFIHDGEGNGSLETRAEPPETENESLHIKTGEKLESIIHEFQPPFALSEKFNVQWLNECVNKLSESERKEFYENLNIWMTPASSNELIQLIQQNSGDAILVDEFVTLLPSTMMFNQQKEVDKIIEFLEIQLKNPYPGVLDKYLYAHKDICNQQKDSMTLLNALKDYASQKLSGFDFLNVVKQYNNLFEQSVFTAVTEVRHIHMQVDNLKIYQYLGLKNTSLAEVNIWAENLVSNLFRKQEMTDNWKFEDYHCKSLNIHQKKWIIFIKKESRLNEEMFIQGFNHILNHIRTLNPDKLLNLDFDTNQWFNNYWLKAIVEKSLAHYDEISEEAEKMNKI